MTRSGSADADGRAADAPRSLVDLLAGLPPAPDEASLLPRIRDAAAQGARPLVVVDDDPTGVQTVRATTVLLQWEQADLEAAFATADPLFFLLTNSRSSPEEEAVATNRRLGRELAAAWRGRPGRFALASRSDSTLRGHFPAEPLALQEGLGEPFDGILLIPAFFEGGRFTVNDTHWVAAPDLPPGRVVPASATPFARDAVFGYRSAHLPAWVEEKSHGRWRARDVVCIPLAATREGPAAVRDRLLAVSGGVPVVVNAAGYGDLASFTLGLLEAEARGKRFVYRTAASFVRLRAGLGPRPLLDGEAVYRACGEADSEAAAARGLVVVGSHVPSSTEQLSRLLAAEGLDTEPIEVDVRAVLEAGFSAARVGQAAGAALRAGRLPVLYTSRELVARAGDESLAVGRRVMDALMAALAALDVRPRFVIAKGGITSHEVTRRGLGAHRATVLGQLLPGVPVWRLEAGPELRFPGVPYVVFPGNVGGPESLVQAVRQLDRALPAARRRAPRPSDAARGTRAPSSLQVRSAPARERAAYPRRSSQP